MKTFIVKSEDCFFPYLETEYKDLTMTRLANHLSIK